MLPVLYSFRRCPYAMRARMSLWLMRIPVMVYELALKNKPSEFLALSPKGTVPVLSFHDGEPIIEESIEIMAYAFDNAKASHGIKDNRCHALITKNDTVFKPLLDKYKYHVRFAHSQEDARKGCIDGIIQELEEKTAGQLFLEGRNASFVDLAIFPFVRQFANVEPERFTQDFPSLAKWLKYWQKSDCFEAIMKKYPLAHLTPLF